MSDAQRRLIQVYAFGVREPALQPEGYAWSRCTLGGPELGDASQIGLRPVAATGVETLCWALEFFATWAIGHKHMRFQNPGNMDATERQGCPVSGVCAKPGTGRAVSLAFQPHLATPQTPRTHEDASRNKAHETPRDQDVSVACFDRKTTRVHRSRVCLDPSSRVACNGE